MNLAEPFIRRPVGTVLCTAGVLLLGALAYTRLPIAALPSVERPTISVSGILPGASPSTVATSLAQPLERTLGIIPGIVEMASFSATGGAQITIQFTLDTDIDAAVSAVQAAIAAANPNLPPDMPQPPRFWRSNTSGASVMALAVTSDTVSAGEVYEYADSVVVQQLSRVPGVARVVINGAERGAVRVSVSARRLAQMGISLETVQEAVLSGSANLPKGVLNTPQGQYVVAANDQLINAVQYADIVVAWRNGAPVRLGDIASITDDVINNKLAGWYNLQRAVIIYVFKNPDANVVETVDGIKSLLPQMHRWLPPSVKLNVVYDRTLLIRSSISEVGFTLTIAAILVILVTWMFLRRMKAVLISATTIPVALAATLALIYVFGFSLNNLSLMALTIGIGFIVDDAVIIVENIMRRVELGSSAKDAATGCARDMGFTICAITASLAAALIPVLFMPDVVGRYFREFGITTIALLTSSALVSLTLTPMMCRWLDVGRGMKRKNPSVRGDAYAACLRLSLKHNIAGLGIVLCAVAASYVIYQSIPKGFMPTQDTGILNVRTVTIPNISFNAMEKLQREVAAAILEDPAVDALASYIGTNNGSVLSSGNLLVTLKPIAERGLSILQVIDRLRRRVADIQNVRTFFTPWQDLALGAQGSIARYQYTLIGSDPAQVTQWSVLMRRRISELREVTDVISNNDTVGLEAQLAFDRIRAAAVGVTPVEIDNILYNAFGQRQLNTIFLPHNFGRVILEIDQANRSDPNTLGDIYLPGRGRDQVPLAELAQLSTGFAPTWISHNGLFPSSTIFFDTAQGASIGQAIAAIRALEQAVGLPAGMQADFKGEAAAATRVDNTQLLLFAAAIFAVYIILGVLYESFVHPLVILSSLPPAACGAFLALSWMNLEFSLVTTIGCILVVGMVMKNGILMVDAALDYERSRQLTPTQAILAAAMDRVRPITMTSIISILAALPLAIGSGIGFELRQPLGVAIVGGLALSQLLTLFITPSVYLILGRLHARTPSSYPIPQLDRTANATTVSRDRV